MTVTSRLDGRKFRRFKGVGTRASYVFAYVNATTSFRSKMRIEKLEGNRVGGCCQYLRQLGLGDEQKMRFRGGEVVFYILKFRSKTANVVEIYVKKG